MAQPIDYTPLDPFAASLSGLKFGMGLAEVKQRQMLQEQQKRAQEQYQQAFSRIQSPNATATDYENLILLSGKDQAENIRKVLEGRDARQNQNTLKQIGGVAFALKTGSPEQASMLLMRQAEAAQNSGDANEAQYLRQMAELAKTQPDNVGNLFASQMTFIPGGKEALDNLLKLTKEKREEQEFRPTLKKLEAEALEKGVQAEFARPTAEANLAKLNKEKLAPSVQEAIDFKNLSPEDQRLFQNLQILKKPPAAVTNVSVQNLDKTAASELGKLVPDLYNQANSAVSQLQDLPRYRAALDKAITGPFAEQVLSGLRLANAVGFTGDKAIEATREVIQGLSEMALKSRSMLTGQGAITEGEQRLLIKARSGDIDFTKSELNKIFDVADRAAKAQYQQSKKLLSSASADSPTARMFLENVQPLPESGESVKVGSQTYTRPANFTDAQWNAYKQSVGAR